jgi:hypothetical protein
MSLHSGIDTVAVVSIGQYTETYGAASPANIANLYASLGLLEDAPNITQSIIPVIIHHLRQVGGL